MDSLEFLFPLTAIEAPGSSAIRCPSETSDDSWKKNKMIHSWKVSKLPIASVSKVYPTINCLISWQRRPSGWIQLKDDPIAWLFRLSQGNFFRKFLGPPWDASSFLKNRFRIFCAGFRRFRREVSGNPENRADFETLQTTHWCLQSANVYRTAEINGGFRFLTTDTRGISWRPPRSSVHIIMSGRRCQKPT